MVCSPTLRLSYTRTLHNTAVGDDDDDDDYNYDADDDDDDDYEGTPES